MLVKEGFPLWTDGEPGRLRERMTREQALLTLQTFYRQHGLLHSGQKADLPGGVMLKTAQLSFEYEPEGGALICRALIYRFQKEPHPKVLEKFRE